MKNHVPLLLLMTALGCNKLDPTDKPECLVEADCPQGQACVDQRCQPPPDTCGNGALDPGETCDPLIVDGLGACPASCNDGVACTTDAFSGNAALCNFECQNAVIVECNDGDGCCPAGCNQNSDSDCSATCGNGQIEALETCDGNCPASCNDGNSCSTDMLVGAANNCSAACAYEQLTACQSGDGCCPAGCTNATDSDCSATCGNSTIDPGETCDGNCPTSCEDNNACTQDTLTGAANNCSATCIFQPITGCSDGDGCCPAGCTNATDNDCSATCGNDMVDSGETCDGDCPQSCEDNDACTQDTLIGSPNNCSAVCLNSAISACMGGDGCCPAGCTNATDSDCNDSCGNNMPDSGETCDGDCPTMCPDSGDVCNPNVLIGSAQNCDVECVSAPITACMGGDGCCAPGCDSMNDSDCPPPPPPTDIGLPCSMASPCPGGLICEMNPDWGYGELVGGYCTSICGSGCPAGSTCVDYLCMKDCAQASDCRAPQYSCYAPMGGPQSVCLPTPS